MRTESGRRIRSTTDSPWYAGSVLTRKSICALSTVNLMRPSCGRRFSAMSMPAMIFKRLISGPFIRSGMRSRSTHSPSMR